MQYKNKNSEIHDTSNYSSQEKGAAPPDLLIAHKWNYANRNNKTINYLATIEIKSPILDSIYDKNEYREHTTNEVRFHLMANNKVILTTEFIAHPISIKRKVQRIFVSTSPPHLCSGAGNISRSAHFKLTVWCIKGNGV